MTPGHDGRARQRALDLNVVVIEADTLGGQRIDARRRYHAAVHTEVAPVDVIIQQNEHDVGCPRLFIAQVLSLRSCGSEAS